MKNKIILVTLISLASTLFAIGQSKEATIVKLVETPGQFDTKELKLKAGSYQFEITNKGVDHEVAFFLQQENDKGKQDFATALPNSGLSKTIKDGETSKTGVVALAKGTYVYSCPLNPTPHYKIIVE
jgi:plastocyanin